MNRTFETAFGKKMTAGQFLKMYFAAMGLVFLAAAYLFACVWIGSDYSYTGGWFLFLAAFMMPIRLKGNPLRVLIP